MLDSSENLDLVNSTATGNLLQADNSSALISETAYGLDPIPVENLQTGIFTVGETGEVTFDYLFDGGSFQGELAIFNIEGMDLYGGGSKIFHQEAALRALQNSPEWGHVIISDASEGAKFSGATEYEGDFNQGEYLGSKTFAMNPGTRFGVMLVADGTIQDTLLNPDLIGANRPLFSLAAANPEEEIQFVKVLETGEDGDRREQGEAFGFEDVPINQEYSDKDFNDLMFQVEGATGKVTLLGEVINPERDWRKSTIGEEIIQAAVDAEDLAGNTIDENRKVNVASNGKTYQGWVGSNDTDDYHAFSLGATNEFELSLDGLSNDANVELLDKEGNVILSSANSGTKAESISTTLSTGNYRVRVSSADEFGTPYNMKLSVNPSLEGITTTGSDSQTFLNTQESLPLMQVDNLNSGNTPGLRQDPRFKNIDGRGWATVIIDSGMNLDHPFFGNQINGRSKQIVSSIDLSDSPFADNDVDGHGSNVASIAAGFFNDPDKPDNDYSGVAPGANIVNLKVFREQKDPVTGQPVRDSDGVIQRGNFGWVEQALQWVIENAGTNPELNIASVNMSLSGDSNWQQAVSKEGLGDELQKLSDLGIIVVSSSGNDFSKNNFQQGVGYPSADPNSLSIGSVSDTTDQIVSSSQRSGTLTTVFAPGDSIKGAGLNDTPGAGFTTNMSGTSMAAPHVAGMAVLAQQLAVERLSRRLTPDEFRDLLVQTGDLINDGDDENDNVANTGLSFRRANMLNLAEGIEAKRPENILRNSPRPVTVNIRRVTGDFDPIWNDSDWYAILTVDGEKYRTRTADANNITPNWAFTIDSSKELVPITIRILDKDRTSADDQMDLNPSPDSRDLNLLFNQITGDIIRVEDNKILGSRGQLIKLQGFGKGTLQFDITAPPVA